MTKKLATGFEKTYQVFQNTKDRTSDAIGFPPDGVLMMDDTTSVTSLESAAVREIEALLINLHAL